MPVSNWGFKNLRLLHFDLALGGAGTEFRGIVGLTLIELIVMGIATVA